MKSQEEKSIDALFWCMLTAFLFTCISIHIHIHDHAKTIEMKIEAQSEVITETLAKHELCREL